MSQEYEKESIGNPPIVDALKPRDELYAVVVAENVDLRQRLASAEERERGLREALTKISRYPIVFGRNNAYECVARQIASEALGEDGMPPKILSKPTP